MARKLRKLLVVVGISSVSLFNCHGCDTFMDEFLKGFEEGLNGVIDDSFGDIDYDGSDITPTDYLAV